MGPIRFFKSIQWKIIIVYVLLILIAMQVIGAYFVKALESHYVNNFSQTLDQQTSLFAYNVQGHLSQRTSEDAQASVTDINFLVDTIFTAPQIEAQVLDRNGIVVGTTSDKQAIIGQKNTQLEVKRALAGAKEESIRLHPINGHRMKIITQSIKVDNDIIGAVYIMASMEDMYETINDINRILATGTVIALLLTAGLGITLARTITSPIQEMTTHAVAMADGDFTRQVKIYGKDEIGRLAQAFNELSARLSVALKENEEEKNKLASILLNMSDGVIATDRAGNIILVNHKVEEMLQQPTAELEGRTITEILPIPQDDIRQSKDDNHLLIELTQKGQVKTLQVSQSHLTNTKENEQGIIFVLQDVTQQEQLARERKEFVANVSHELRTPLTTMKSYLEALEDGVLENKELAPRFLKVTQNETERMIRLVNDLLQLSKMDGKVGPAKLQWVPFELLVKERIEHFSVDARQREIDINFQSEEELPLIQVDKDQMTQVIDNLISNALKYSNPESHVYVEVKLTEQAKGEQGLQIDIRDEGVGIPESDLPHIFTRFYRVDKARSREMGGTGLGLSIAREMIEAHHGSISIQSEYEQGTTVSIILPLSQQKKGAAS